jgi:hypothetical protein
MTEETEYSDDIEYDDIKAGPSLTRKVLVAMGDAVLALAAGYLIGWGIAIVITRLTGTS